MSEIPYKAKRYILVLALISTIFLIFTVNYYSIGNYKIIAILGVLSVIAETFLVQMPGIGSISVSFAITFAAIILGGPITGIIVSVVGITFSRPYVDGRGYIHIFNTPVYKTMFNISQNILYTGLAAIVYVQLHIKFLSLGAIDPISTIFSMATFLLINTLLMTVLIMNLTGGKFSYIWSENFRGMILSVSAVGLLGIIIAISYSNYGAGAVVLFFIPLMLSRYSFKLYVDMRKNYYDTVKALINAIEAKDPYTSGHASRVGKYAVAIATEMELSSKQIETLRNAALLHDIGKIGVNDNILNKQDRLSDIELEVIKSHPTMGYDIIKDIGFLKDVMEIVKHHHERWDGKGYPEGLLKEEIPIEACILTVSDSFDAMTTDRPYRKALTVAQALNEIKLNEGTQFNPKLIEVSVKTLGKFVDEIENIYENNEKDKNKGIA